ncbi:MAG: transglutaminase family protein [Planctomycetota bacterium]
MNPHPLIALTLRVLTLLALSALAAPTQAGDRPEGYDRWYAIQIRGESAGWMHSRQVVTGERVDSTTVMKLSMSRGALTIDVEMTSAFSETIDGKPLSMRTIQQLGAQPTETEYTFTDDALIARTTQGGRALEATLALPTGAWLTPAQAERYVAKRMDAGAESISVRTIEPLSGPAPITVTRSDFVEEKLTLDGQTYDAIRTNVTSSSTPGLTTTEYLDQEGSIIKTSVSMGGIPIDMLLADASVARGQLDAPELMVSTFVRPDRPITRPRDQRRAVYRVTGPPATLKEIPSTAAQRARAIEPGVVEVTVDEDNPATANAEQLRDPVWLDSSAYINAEDTLIRALAEQAVTNAGKNRAKRAEAMRRFVFRHINRKNLGVGFATAAEVARTREGDCSEHAALLAALLRADGIPARVAAGLIYADRFAGAQDIFGFHMWTQALLTDEEGELRWVDLDATLPDRTPFDATHITLSVSALAQGEAHNALSSIAPLLGTLSIEVVETSP